jgi:hypothetical protein
MPARLRRRDPRRTSPSSRTEWFTCSAGELQAALNWAEWLRSHARERHVRVIDTSALSAERVADELAAWIAAERDD